MEASYRARERLRVNSVTRTATLSNVGERRCETGVGRASVLPLRIAAVTKRAEVAEGVVAVRRPRPAQHRLRASNLMAIAALRCRRTRLRTRFGWHREKRADSDGPDNVHFALRLLQQSLVK